MTGQRVALKHSALAVCVPLVATILAACAVAPREAKSVRIALVIGNSAYENLPALNNPVNDANDMCAALKHLGFQTLCHTNLRDREEFEARVKEYTDLLQPDSESVFYYSGHGVQAGNVNYLIPTNPKLKSVRENPVGVLYGVDELFDRLREKPTKFQLVILDACRTDLFARAPVQNSTRGVNSSAVPNLTRSLETVAHARYGLATIQDAPVGSIVFYATASKEAAYDGEGRNGPLTRYILEHINTRDLKVEDFFKRVSSGVKNETRNYRKPQTPVYSSSFNGDFCFAGCPGEIVRDIYVAPAG
jgi:uncharacterized caspase-like protein